MDTRVHDQHIEMRVLQALAHYKPEISRHIVVAATPDGAVWLRGLTLNQADRLTILHLVGDVPGVTEIFFNVALMA